MNSIPTNASRQAGKLDQAESQAESKTNALNSTRLGQLFFSSMSHNLYDFGLYRFVTGKFWHCPTERLLDNYADNITNNHLEVGVGSGYFLHHTLCADFLRRLSLLDLNRRCLRKSAARLSAYAPALHHQSALQPLPPSARHFGSVGMNYVLHCIPGSFSHNRVLFENLHAALREGGVLFGATLLANTPSQSLVTRLFMRLLNKVGIFHNEQQTAADLRATLGAVFKSVRVTMIGNAAVFVAVK